MSLETAFNSLLQRYPLAAALIGPDDELLHSSSQAARHLSHGTGVSPLGLAGMLSKPLQAALWPALWQARQTGQEAISRQVESEHPGYVLHLRVVPARMEGCPDGAMLILFNETPAIRPQAPLDLIHPEDRANAFARLEGVGWDSADLSSCEHRIRCSDDNWKRVLNRGASVGWDRDGSPLRIVG
ncbi:MAG: PAS domain-containing protein, partial [Burkholderiaceae bacterium]